MNIKSVIASILGGGCLDTDIRDFVLKDDSIVLVALKDGANFKIDLISKKCKRYWWRVE